MSKPKQAETTPPAMPDQCPICIAIPHGGPDHAKLYEYPTGRYCPAEDPHPGGLFIGLDGVVRQRSIISASMTPSEAK